MILIKFEISQSGHLWEAHSCLGLAFSVNELWILPSAELGRLLAQEFELTFVSHDKLYQDRTVCNAPVALFEPFCLDSSEQEACMTFDVPSRLYSYSPQKKVTSCTWATTNLHGCGVQLAL